MRRLRILDVFPSHFNVNGDGGNVLALRRRLAWSGFDVEVIAVVLGEAWPGEFSPAHLGGGTVAAQRAALPALLAERARIADWVADAVPLLAVAGGFQLALDQLQFPGETAAEEGLGVFGGRSRPVPHAPGPVVGRHPELGWVSGYQNLAQGVELAAGQPPLLVVHAGIGNESAPDTEGAVAGTAVGSRLHGPLLPRNPALADLLIRQALGRIGAAEDYRHEDRHRQADHYARQAWRVLRERLKLRTSDADEAQAPT